MNYSAMYRSNLVEIAAEHVDEVEKLLGGNPTETGYRFDGQYELDGTGLVLFSTHTTFTARTPADEQVTDQFLERLGEYLADGEVLVIRNVGYTGARHIPDAYQHIVPANGEVETESLRSPDELGNNGRSETGHLSKRPAPRRRRRHRRHDTATTTDTKQARHYRRTTRQ